jgi:hypothetical protein
MVEHAAAMRQLAGVERPDRAVVKAYEWRREQRLGGAPLPVPKEIGAAALEREDVAVGTVGLHDRHDPGRP